MKKISIIVPVYNEEKNVPLMYKALSDVAEKMTGYEFEFLFINDGSKDGSWNIMQNIAKSDSRVRAIDFSRNFGKEIALTAGVQNCTGDAAMFLDADLQHPPSLIPEFISKWENGAEVVASIRVSTEKKSFVKNAGSKCFYKLVHLMGASQLTSNATDFKLIDRKVINELVKFTEHKRLFRGLVEWLGFHTEYIEFVAPERANGVPTYSLKKLVPLAVNSVMSFSLLPLKIVGCLGAFISSISFLLLCFMSVHYFILRTDLFSSISFVIVFNTLVLGIVLMSQGIMALYIGQIHGEVIGRPLYVIRERVGRDI